MYVIDGGEACPNCSTSKQSFTESSVTVLSRREQVIGDRVSKIEHEAVNAFFLERGATLRLFSRQNGSWLHYSNRQDEVARFRWQAARSSRYSSLRIAANRRQPLSGFFLKKKPPFTALKKST
jgi:hypothetical protein